jgi:outer membrane immunogenic protein
MICKRLLLASVSSLALLAAPVMASSASAADMPVKAPPAADPHFSWAGFYIGLHGGAAWLDHRQETTTPGLLGPIGVCGAGAGPTDCSIRGSGGAFGALAGYNFQSGRVVYGVEIDGTWLSISGSRIFATAPVVSDPLTIHTKISWLATVRGRLGLTMSPTLVYVTGGAAFGRIRSGWFEGSNVPIALTIDQTRAGWVAGGGIEHAFARNWTVRIEGLFHDLGSVSGSTTGSGTTYNSTFRHRVTTVRGALALRF